MASTYLTRTFQASNRRTFTISVWFKRTGLDQFNYIFDCDGGSSQSENQLGLYDDRIGFGVWNSSTSSSAIDIRVGRKIRDTNAWYHVVCAVDTTQATASNRVKIYLNGELQTDLTSNTYPSQNYETAINSAIAHDIGRWSDGTSRYFNGVMSHFHFIDGATYDASTFGSTDSTTGEWKINTSPTISDYGTNGFWILKDGNSVTDQSPNTNNFTVGGGTLTKTEDNPSNVFCTMNSLNHDYANTNTDLGAGNTFVYPRDNGNYTYAMSTLAMPKGNGKFYFEAKYVQYDGVIAGVGIVNMDYASDIFYQNRQIMQHTQTTDIGRVLLNKAGYSIISGATNDAYGFGTWSNGDIICMACDMENGAFYFRKNGGSWANSGDPTSGSSKTGAIDISSTSQWTSSSHWGIWCGDNESNHDRFSFNFGNGNFPSQSGSFGSQTYSATAVSSAGSNASGIGIFEYDVPTGYTALSTKGLNL